ncbi:site-specific integrase [Actinomadura violacea]|uniref:Site-specific integrase n=1 Tax=Actinomadura violacea TaxID=2819934 RepID=A0ABS3RWX1_9ACTN|nr:site-specific integrase [Actinomadura violacea]
MSFPEGIVPLIRERPAGARREDAAALVFAGPDGRVLRRASQCALAVETPRLAKPHFRALRHMGNTLASQGGASLRDLMDRMGHDSVRAAMIYQHATSEAGGDDDEDDGGLGGALVPVA